MIGHGKGEGASSPQVKLMIKSMTGFGAASRENEAYRAQVEVKSVNQRYLDVNFYMPRALNAFEAEMKKQVKSYAARGKIDVNILFEDKREREVTVTVNRKLALAYKNALEELSTALHLTPPRDVCKIAMCEGVVRVEEKAQNLEDVGEVLLPTLCEALEGFRTMREAEGENLKRDFLQRLVLMGQMVEELAALTPAIVERYRLHLENFLTEALQGHAFDETRLLQETALYADRINYHEEVVRLLSHFQQFQAILADAEGPIGRKLDFLVQEMNREANTIGSKANAQEAARLVVNLKSEIEKLREQIQNIE